MDRIEKAEAKYRKAKDDLAAVKRQAAAQERKARSTAIHTIGACWASMLENESTREMALEMWTRHFAPIAPSVASDRRRQSLELVFNLTIPESTSIPLSESTRHEAVDRRVFPEDIAPAIDYTRLDEPSTEQEEGGNDR